MTRRRPAIDPTPKAAPAVRLSLRAEMEQRLDGCIEHELDDDNYRLRNERPYSDRPPVAAGLVVKGLVDLDLPAAVKRRLGALRPSLAELLRTTPLDDLEGASLLAWIAERAPLQFVDDSRRVSAEAEAELRGAVAEAVAAAVRRKDSIAAMATRLEKAVALWAKRHARGAALVGFGADLEGSLSGVGAYRTADEQAAIVDDVVQRTVHALAIKWVPKPRPARPYSPSETYREGDRVTHAKFGAGEVLRRLDGKVEIAFRDGPRILAAGHSTG